MSYLWSRTTPKSEFLFFCPAPPLAALAGLIQRREVSIAVHRRQFGGSIFRLAATKALCCTAFVWAASYDLFCFRLVIKPIDLSPIFLGHFRGQQSSAAGNFRIKTRSSNSFSLLRSWAASIQAKASPQPWRLTLSDGTIT